MLVRPEADDADGGRIDFEDGMTYAPRATLALLVVLAAVFYWEIVSRAFLSREAIVAAGALVRARVLDGELWRIGSATFLHGGPDHLLGNCVSLYILGMACEHAVGWRRLLTVFAAGAIGGSAPRPPLKPRPRVRGARAVFGVTGAVVVILHPYRDLFVI